MRIMATSDLHGNLDGLDPTGADVVVFAGDVAPLRGRGPWHVNDQKKWINKRFREWTASISNPAESTTSRVSTSGTKSPTSRHCWMCDGEPCKH
ncbi:MAG: hypothetical protein IKL96_05030 [Kiritimatiellae bacterium]|nr:hypothetical protein [Kiritimatiellia bacterium]